MAKLNSKEWFVATKNGVVLKNSDGWAMMGKTKTLVEHDILREDLDIKTVEIKKIELVIN